MLVGYAFKSTVILIAAWLVAASLRRNSAAARHLIWTGAMASIVVLPLLSMALPAWRTPVETANLVFTIAAGVAGPLGVGPASTVPVAAGDGGSGVAESRVNWQVAAAAVWAGGSALLLCSMLVSYLRMMQWRRKAAVLPLEGLTSPVPLLRADRGSMPMTFGVLHPVVFLPGDAGEWEPERLRMVLLHELAHVERADVLTQLVARAALAMHWWNPLAWKAWSEFVKERERAADDLVLASGARGSEYAGHLLAIARLMLEVPTAAASAAVAMARPHPLEDRLAAILDSGMRRHAPSRGWALAALLVAVPLAAFQVTDPRNADAVQTAMASRQYDEAKKLLESELAASRNPVERGLTLFRLGELAARRDDKDQAESHYKMAAETLGSRPEAARALIKLGVVAIGKKDLAGAFEFFDRAVRVKPDASAEASLWMGVVRRAENMPEQAETHFRDALARQDPKSPESFTIGQIYAQFLSSQGRSAEAGEMHSRIAAVRKETALRVNPPAANVLRIGGETKAPKLLKKTEPIYSEEARAAKLTGTTVMSVEVHPDGRAHNIQVLQPVGLGLDDRAIESVGLWEFQPATRNGLPVPVSATIEVNWKML